MARVGAWLLTPVVAWAASFLGGWLGAALGLAVAAPRHGPVWLGVGSVVGAVLGAAAWVMVLRRVERRRDADPGDSGA